MIVLNNDPVTVERVTHLRANASYFEKMMPVAEEFKKAPGFTPPQAEGAFMLYAGGSAGEQPYLGKNLPNEQAIREIYGSKSHTALNRMHDIGQDVQGEAYRWKPFYMEKYHEGYVKVDDDLSSDVQVEFHEVLGHGSGKMLPNVAQNALKEYYNPLEECRAETASLYHLLDPKLRELGIIPKTMTDADVDLFNEMTIVRFFTGQLRGYESLPDDAQAIRQAHRWARQVMLNYLIEAGALRIVEGPEGVPQVDVVSLEKVRKELGGLWHTIQEAKSTGSYELAKQVFDGYGQYQEIHKKWRGAIKAMIAKLKLPTTWAVLNPKMELVKSPDGAILDVVLKYQKAETVVDTFIRRQLELTEKYQETVRACDSYLQGAPDGPAPSFND